MAAGIALPGRRAAPAASWTPAPASARLLLAAVVAAAVITGFAVTGEAARNQAVMASGADLTRLLRAMAAIKALMATGAVAGVAWRLGMPVGWLRLASYAVACGAMAAGPGLIWGMAHVGLGALLLHGGLILSVVMLWQDPAVAAGLARIVAARRARA